jgi:hypothetical protein
MKLGLAVGLVAALPSLAAARPITAGVGIGRIQSEQAGEAQDTLQIFGRLGLTPRVSGQVELQKIELASEGAVARTGTALLVVDLGSGGRLMPTMFGGLGLDRSSSPYGSARGTHLEGGFGLEYRADGGFTIGADLRLGGRSIEEEVIAYPAYADSALYYAPQLPEGEYRSARVFAGIRF